ncbi:MAG: thioredoxin family protein [Saccharospirillaceae bacterium]|nr:thioredoxin family protein [Pseudomonadales bacterium]NRB78804.1 thioredoxin family protein [Saccharospirillaceae bacterium]
MQTQNKLQETKYTDQQIEKSELIQSKGWLLLEFGENWCPICQQAQPLIAAALLSFPELKRKMIIDGKGKRLGRLLKVKLWPSLILLYNGETKGTLVRPNSQLQIESWLNEIKNT